MQQKLLCITCMCVCSLLCSDLLKGILNHSFNFEALTEHTFPGVPIDLKSIYVTKDLRSTKKEFPLISMLFKFI